MKKILIVAALLATAALPATPSYAAAKAAAPAPKMTAICFFLPLLPNCLAEWKAGMGKMAPPKVAMAMPKMSMPIMPTCTKAPAGSGHLFICK